MVLTILLLLCRSLLLALGWLMQTCNVLGRYLDLSLQQNPFPAPLPPYPQVRVLLLLMLCWTWAGADSASYKWTLLSMLR